MKPAPNTTNPNHKVKAMMTTGAYMCMLFVMTFNPDNMNSTLANMASLVYTRLFKM